MTFDDPSDWQVDPIMQARQVLHKFRLLQKVCAEMHKRRRTALFVNVMAALHGKVLTVTHLGRPIPERGQRDALCQTPGSLVIESPVAGRTIRCLRPPLLTAAQQLYGNAERSRALPPQIFDLGRVHMLLEDHLANRGQHRVILFALPTFGRWHKKYGSTEHLPRWEQS